MNGGAVPKAASQEKQNMTVAAAVAADGVGKAGHGAEMCALGTRGKGAGA